MRTYELVSTVLCPHTQRAAILLAEKEAAYQRVYLEPNSRPSWFEAVSPLGHTPLLRIGDRTIFEIGAICEYIEDTTEPKLLPADLFLRARQRMWTEFANAAIADIFGLYSAADAKGFEQKRQDLQKKTAWFAEALEPGLRPAGADFSLADAAWAPVFRLLDIVENIGRVRILDSASRLDAYRSDLRERRSVNEVVVADYAERFSRYLATRESYLSMLLTAQAAGAR